MESAARDQQGNRNCLIAHSIRTRHFHAIPTVPG
jgi:hypothetical protein